MKPIWAILISVLVAAGLAGGGTYYFLNKQATTDKNNLQSQITDLNTKVADTEKSLAEAQAGIATTGTAPSDATNAFSLVNLEAATVNVSDANYKLASGSYSDPTTGVAVSTITLDQTNHAVDSVNANQAAIILGVHGRVSGGNATYKVLEIMTNSTGTPKYLAKILLNDYYDATVNNITFASNIVTVNFVPFQQTVAVTKTFQLTNGTLVAQ